MENKWVHIDLFSGIGGMHLGLVNAGFDFTHHYFSEIDKHCIANYKYNFPNAEYIGSVKDVSGRAIRQKHIGENIIITFGWPCQDNSIAGKRKGHSAGTRSSLLFEAGRIISECKCELFIAENVKGLFSVNEGNDFYEAIRFLTYLDTDSPQYTVEMQLLNTSWVLPQNRERTYFVGHIGTRGIKRIFPVTENDCRVTERSGDTTSVRTLTGGGGKQKIVAMRGRNTDNGIEQKLEVNNDDQCNSLTGVQKDNLVITHYGHKNKEAAISKDCPTLKAESHGHEPMIGNTNMNGEVFENDFSGNLRANASANYQLVNNIRRLTEIECERLQGFPDDWTSKGVYDGEVKKISRTSRYKMCGNAVTVSIVELIGKKLLNAAK